MSTAARTARFSMLMSRAAASGADPSRLDERDGSARVATPPARGHEAARVRPARTAHIPSTSARTDTPRATAARPATDRRRRRRPRAGRARSRSSRAGNGGQRVAHLTEQHGKRLAQHRGPSDHDDRRPRGRRVTRGPIRLAQSPPRTIALHRQPQLAAHREADTCGFVRFSPEHDERRTIDPLAPLKKRLELGVGGQSLASREAATQTVSRLRPFARRRFNTLRPPFVFMRSRNPCVLARRRVLG